MEKRPSDYHVLILDKQDKSDGEDGTIKWVTPSQLEINVKHNPARYAAVDEVSEVDDKKPDNKEADDTEELTRAELVEIAKEKDIAGASRMKKAELIELLNK